MIGRLGVVAGTAAALTPLALMTFFTAAVAGGGGAPGASAAAVADIPPALLPLYQRAAAGSCAMPWPVLAAVGKVETDHGRSTLTGVRDGANAAGAAGPMQIGIGGRAGNTWGGEPVRPARPAVRYGTDGDGDGLASVYDADDAIHAAAAYLCHHGAGDAATLRDAVWAYNHASWYVDEVLAVAASYTGATVDRPVADGGSGPWGGYQNGRIPTGALCPLEDRDGQHLRCDAAQAFARMDTAYRAELGRPIAVTDSYRDLPGQIEARRRWCARGACRMAAEPGASNHGWGLALDLGGGINDFGTPQHEWMRANAPRFGWVHPEWARQGGSKPEPWHWEYTGQPAPAP